MEDLVNSVNSQLLKISARVSVVFSVDHKGIVSVRLDDKVPLTVSKVLALQLRFDPGEGLLKQQTCA